MFQISPIVEGLGVQPGFARLLYHGMKSIPIPPSRRPLEGEDAMPPTLTAHETKLTHISKGAVHSRDGPGSRASRRLNFSSYLWYTGCAPFVHQEAWPLSVVHGLQG